MRGFLYPVAALMLGGCSSGSRPGDASAPVKTEVTPVRVTQFYANPPALPKGGKALLCYGVEGASKVRIEPPVEQLAPSLSRCFEVQPTRSTEYKLIAENASGASAEATAAITLGSAAPVLFDLAVSKTKVKAGELISFCFQTRNAVRVTGGPGRFQFGGRAAKDCLLDQPTKTTSYRVTAANNDGLSDTASVTVEVQ